MIKKSVSLPEKLDEKIQDKSDEFGISQAEFIRGAVRRDLE